MKHKLNYHHHYALLPLMLLHVSVFDICQLLGSALYISYHRYTIQLVKDIQNGWVNNPFTTLRVTCVSLGGGVAIVTGAQTDDSTVAISRPNGRLCSCSHSFL